MAICNNMDRKMPETDAEKQFLYKIKSLKDKFYSLYIQVTFAVFVHRLGQNWGCCMGICKRPTVKISSKVPYF